MNCPRCNEATLYWWETGSGAENHVCPNGHQWEKRDASHLTPVTMEITTPVTITTVPISQVDHALDCTVCGPLGVYHTTEVSTFVFDHLSVVHGCNMDTVDIRDLPDQQENQ